MTSLENNNNIKINAKFGSLTARKWDSAKRPQGTRDFMDDMGQSVSLIKCGDTLERFLDHLCKRSRERIFPAWQKGGEFASLLEPLPQLTSDVDSQATTTEATGSATRGRTSGDGGEDRDREEEDGGSDRRQLGGEPSYSPVRSVTYSEAARAERHFGEIPEYLKIHHWDRDTRELDKLLHGTLMQLVSGPKKDVIRNCVTPSYVLAMGNLWLQDRVTRSERQQLALRGIQKLEYKGDIDKFSDAATKAISEFYASGITVEDIILLHIRDAFEARYKHIKVRIGQDIDSEEPKRPILLDLVAEYCQLVASAGDGRGSRDVNYTSKGKGKGKGGRGGGKGKGGRGRDSNRDKDPRPPKEEKSSGGTKESVYTAEESKKLAEALASKKKKKKEANMIIRPNEINLTLKKPRQEAGGGEIWISLFDGIGCGAMSMHDLDPVKDKYIAVESKASRRAMADHANPPTSTFPGITRELGHDVMDITRQMIKDLGPIRGMKAGWPCQNLSWLRTRTGQDGRIPSPAERSGLDGAESGKYHKMKQVWGWIKEFNPDADYIIENVHFRCPELQDQWDQVCSDFGTPLIVNSKDHSYSHRKRCWWTSFKLPPDLFEDMKPQDPNECLDEGRTFDLKRGIRTVTASWRGDPHDPDQYTSRPIIIKDVKLRGDQPIRSHEAEKLHHMKPGCTAAPGMTEADRLSAIGDGWDIRIAKRICEQLPDHTPAPEDEEQQALFAQLAYDLDELTPEDKEHLPAMAELDAEELEALAAEMGEKAGHIFRLYATSQYLHSECNLIDHNSDEFAVLDSGSSAHVSKRVQVTDPNSTMQLQGFQGSRATTGGVGDLTLMVKDKSDQRIDVTFTEADQLDMVKRDLLSIGKMLHDGWSFHLNDTADLTAWTPQGREIQLALTSNDLLAMPLTRSHSETNQISKNMDKVTADFLHSTLLHRDAEKIFRTLQNTKGYEAKRLPPSKCDACAQAKSKKKGIKKVHFTFLTEAVTPRSGEVHALEDAADMDSNSDSSDEEYVSTPTSSLSSEDEMPDLIRESDSEPEFEDPGDESSSDSSDEEDEEEQRDQPFVRRIPQPQQPRFNLETARPWEFSFWDNKTFNEFDLKVRGSPQQCILCIDMASYAIRVQSVPSKKDNGKAFKAMVAQEGIEKLPYLCTAYADGCGSMKHVMDAAHSRTMRFEPIPPYEQSLNEAEKICNFTWNEAAALILHAGAPWKWFYHALLYCVYVHERMATTESRGWKTPYEILTGQQPDISHLRPFWSKCYVNLPAPKRQDRAAKNKPPLRAEKGHFIGFQTLRSSTFSVVLSGDRLVHSRSVDFDDELPEPIEPEHTDDEVEVEDEYENVEFEGVQDPKLKLKTEDCHAQGGAQLDDSIDESITQGGVSEDNPLLREDSPQGEWLEDVYVEPLSPLREDSQSPSITPPHREEERDRRRAWQDHMLNNQPPPFRRSRKQQHDDAQVNICEQALNFMEKTDEDSRMVFLTTVDRLMRIDETPDGRQHKMLNSAINFFSKSKNRNRTDGVDFVTLLAAADILAVQGQHDISWKQALAGPNREKAIEAYNKEMASLCDTILERVRPGDEDYQKAMEESVTGRIILDVKRRLGAYKARGVKQGFKEDTLWADGPGFNYYSSVAKLHSARASIFRPNRRNRRCCVVDVATAYLQAHSFDGFVKYICFKNPITGEWEYYRQFGPIYGEKSSAVRWERTIGPWMEERDQGFIRGDNERCVFLHPDRDLTVCLYVDDCLIDGDEDDVKWFLEKISKRFKCKEAEWLEPGAPLDYLGMEVSIDTDKIYMCMENYISNMVKMLDLEKARKSNTPITVPVDASTRALTPVEKKRFMSALGCVGWLVNTTRPDVAYACSRIAQHMAQPTISALQAVEKMVCYLRDTADLALAAPLWEADHTLCRDEFGNHLEPSDTDFWAYFCDSDFAGNSETQNHRRSQNGYIALLNGAPVIWTSKVSSVAFAHPKIGEAHADVSSAAAEIYAAANATYDFFNISYVAEEAGLEVHLPIILQIDNAACEAFINHTADRTKLKHIDCRQEWVKMIRNKKILLPTHVDSADNLADLFTKILDKGTFERLRDQIMVKRHIEHDMNELD